MRFGTQTDEVKTAEINNSLNNDGIFNSKSHQSSNGEGSASEVNEALNRMKSGVNVSEVKTKRTNFDTDLTAEEKEEALRRAKKAEFEKLDKEYKKIKLHYKLSLFFSVTIVPAISYVWYFLSGIFTTYVYLVMPMGSLRYVSKMFSCSQMNDREPIPTIMCNKMIEYHDKAKAKRKQREASRPKGKIFSVDELISFFTVFVRAIISLIGIYLILVAIVMSVAVSPILTIVIIATILNASFGFDKKILDRARERKEHASEEQQEAMEAFDEEYKKAEMRIQERGVEGMTEKEKMDYLKSAGKLEKKY